MRSFLLIQAIRLMKSTRALLKSFFTSNDELSSDELIVLQTKLENNLVSFFSEERQYRSLRSRILDIRAPLCAKNSGGPVTVPAYVEYKSIVELFEHKSRSKPREDIIRLAWISLKRSNVINVLHEDCVSASGFNSVVYNLSKSIASSFGIRIFVDEIKCSKAMLVSSKRNTSIFIDNSLDVEELPFPLIHEIGHYVLNHGGKFDRNLSEIDFELQERDADQFAYALVVILSRILELGLSECKKLHGTSVDEACKYIIKRTYSRTVEEMRQTSNMLISTGERKKHMVLEKALC